MVSILFILLYLVPVLFIVFLFTYLLERVRSRAWRRSFGPDTGRKH